MAVLLQRSTVNVFTRTARVSSSMMIRRHPVVAARLSPQTMEPGFENQKRHHGLPME